MKNKIISDSDISPKQMQILRAAVDMAAKKVLDGLPLRPFFSTANAAKVLNRDPQTLTRWRKENIGPKFTVDDETGRITYTRESLFEYLTENGGKYPEFSENDVAKALSEMMPTVEKMYTSLLNGNASSTKASKNSKPKK